MNCAALRRERLSAISKAAGLERSDRKDEPQLERYFRDGGGGFRRHCIALPACEEHAVKALMYGLTRRKMGCAILKVIPP